eukprot:6185594-Pleurochrysis_carterae.AAC.2
MRKTLLATNEPRSDMDDTESENEAPWWRSVSNLFTPRSVPMGVPAYLNKMMEPPPEDALRVGKARLLCNDPVLCVALSSLDLSEGEGHGQYFAAGTTDNKVFLHRLSDCKLMHVFDVPKKGNSGVNAIVFTRLGEHMKIIIGVYGGNVTTFDVNNRALDAQVWPAVCNVAQMA